MEQGVAFRGGARNRRPGRHGNRSPDTKTRLRGASLHALRRRMPEPETRTRRPKIATAERREARVSRSQGERGAPRKRLGVPQHARVPRKHPRRLGAPSTPRSGAGANDGLNPDAKCVAGTKGAVRDAGKTSAVMQMTPRMAMRRQNVAAPGRPTARIKTPAEARAGRVGGVDPPLRGAPSPGAGRAESTHARAPWRRDRQSLWPRNRLRRSGRPVVRRSLGRPFGQACAVLPSHDAPLWIAASENRK
jgi:hypothetical protein